MSPKKPRTDYKAPATTETGVYLVAADRVGIFAAHRHTDAALANNELNRLAIQNKGRFLLLQVVGVVDARPEDEETEQVETTVSE